MVTVLNQVYDIFTVMNHFAVAPLKAYLFDVLVWAIIGAILLIIFLALFKRTKLFVAIFGALILISSVPIAFMSELSINGCCGTPSTGREGLGYIIGAAIAILGVVILLFGKKLTKRQSSK
jgi:flagellar biosynthesis component FlhA